MVTDVQLAPRVHGSKFDWYFHGSVPRRIAIVDEVVVMLLNLVNNRIHNFFDVHFRDSVVVENEAGDGVDNKVVVDGSLQPQNVHKAAQHALVWI